IQLRFVETRSLGADLYVRAVRSN
ncbi:MAG: hypothetical protein RIS31_344, partial [Actinomycetota bacterium]